MDWAQGWLDALRVARARAIFSPSLYEGYIAARQMERIKARIIKAVDADTQYLSCDATATHRAFVTRKTI